MLLYRGHTQQAPACALSRGEGGAFNLTNACTIKVYYLSLSATHNIHTSCSAQCERIAAAAPLAKCLGQRARTHACGSPLSAATHAL